MVLENTIVPNKILVRVFYNTISSLWSFVLAGYNAIKVYYSKGGVTLQKLNQK